MSLVELPIWIENLSMWNILVYQTLGMVSALFMFVLFPFLWSKLNLDPCVGKGIQTLFCFDFRDFKSMLAMNN